MRFPPGGAQRGTRVTSRAPRCASPAAVGAGSRPVPPGSGATRRPRPAFRPPHLGAGDGDTARARRVDMDRGTRRATTCYDLYARSLTERPTCAALPLCFCWLASRAAARPTPPGFSNPTRQRSGSAARTSTGRRCCATCPRSSKAWKARVCPGCGGRGRREAGLPTAPARDLCPGTRPSGRSRRPAPVPCRGPARSGAPARRAGRRCGRSRPARLGRPGWGRPGWGQRARGWRAAPGRPPAPGRGEAATAKPPETRSQQPHGFGAA